MKHSILPLRLQFFAADSAGAGGASGTENNTQNPPAGQSSSGTAPAIDYAKIQQMLEGTLSAKEDTALKAYFKQQGLSQDEAEQAMTSFKAEKAKNQPDVTAIQTQLTQAQAALQRAQLEQTATMTALSLGLDAKTIPYVLKMADFNGAIGADGKINEDTLKTAVNKVLEDIPALKPQPAGSTGFIQVGTSGRSSGSSGTSDDALKKAFGL